MRIAFACCHVRCCSNSTVEDKKLLRLGSPIILVGHKLTVMSRLLALRYEENKVGKGENSQTSL